MTRYFFTSASTFGTITTGIMSPLSHFYFQLQQFFKDHVFWSDDCSHFYTSKLIHLLLELKQLHQGPGFQAKPHMCWVEQSPVLETMLMSHIQHGARHSAPQHDIVDFSAELSAACDPRVVSCGAGRSLPCLWAADFSSLLQSWYMTSITAHLSIRPVSLPWKDIKLILCDLFLTNQTWL